MSKKLKRGQVVYIDNERYVVINMIEFCEDTWIWQEYEVVGPKKQHRWLTIEKDDNNNDEYWIYDMFRGSIRENGLEITVDNVKYKLYEKGTAMVKGYFGNADVDMHEKCDFIDYISEDEKRIISIEKWETEKEKSKGEFVDTSRIRITDEIDNSVSTVNVNKKSIVISLLFMIGLPIALIVVGVIADMRSNSMINYIENSSKYTYVTSVTNNSNNKKAKVYKSSLATLDATVKDIIDGVPEGITSTIDEDSTTEEDGIGLHTSNEFAYVYKENGEIYVQVSEKEYVSRSGTMYHSSHGRYYHSTYSSNNKSSIYSSYSASARQNSINSRKSSGGGTSSGK